MPPNNRCCGGFIYVMSLPWVCVFRMTVPACERDDFQRWETDKPIRWSDIPALDRETIERPAYSDGQDDDEEEEIVPGMWVRGRFSRQQVRDVCVCVCVCCCCCCCRW